MHIAAEPYSVEHFPFSDHVRNCCRRASQHSFGQGGRDRWSVHNTSHGTRDSGFPWLWWLIVEEYMPRDQEVQMQLFGFSISHIGELSTRSTQSTTRSKPGVFSLLSFLETPWFGCSFSGDQSQAAGFPDVGIEI